MKRFSEKMAMLVSFMAICLMPILYGCDSEWGEKMSGPRYIEWETTSQFTNDKELGEVVLVPAAGETLKFKAKDITSLVIVKVVESDNIDEATSTLYKQYLSDDKSANASAHIEGEYSDVRREGPYITVKIAPNTTKKTRYVFVPTLASEEYFIGPLQFKQSAE